MKSSILCEACESPFIPDCRHRVRQRFCHHVSCQRARRREGQRLRRTNLRDSLHLPALSEPANHRQLNNEAALVKPHQAALKRFHPVIIGLISQFIDSTDPQEVLAFIRRCIERGQDIMFPPRPVKQRRTLKTKGNVTLAATASGKTA